MTEASVILFGDSTLDTSSYLDTLLKTSGSHGPLLSSFLEKAQVGLQQERSALYSAQRAAIPEVISLEALADAETRSRGRHPALHLAEVNLVQLAYFIKYGNLTPLPPPLPPPVPILGMHRCL